MAPAPASDPAELKAARDACESAFADGIHKVTAVLFDCLAAAGDDEEQKTGCRLRYETALKSCREGHQISRNLIGQVFG